MCGIVGYIGNRDAKTVLIEGLKRLEYRGYDSAGVAVCPDGRIDVRKAVGRISQLEQAISEHPLSPAGVGIGHTRWATHGRPSEVNAHPHADEDQEFVVVHNGIIENFAQLRAWLRERGHTFKSETDTEVIPHLIRHFYRGSLVDAVREAVGMLRGAYALAIMSSREPDRLVAVKQASPLIIGLGQGENFIASDIPAVLDYTRRFYVLEEGEMAVITRDGVEVTDFQGRPVEKSVWQVDWDAEMAEKGGYPHFMLKEIHEQPRAIMDTMRGRVDWASGRVVLPELSFAGEPSREGAAFGQGTAQFSRIYVVACGTAYHAGLVGKRLIERWARVPVEADLASEFRYRNPIVDSHTLVIVISQSGETADTLAALREARRRGAHVVAITNVVGSSVAREAHDVIYTWAGPEIAVASTKAYVTQLVALVFLALFLAQERPYPAGGRGQVATTAGQAQPATAQASGDGVAFEVEWRAVIDELRNLSRKAEELLRQEERVRELAESLAAQEQVFFLGRGLDYALAMEAALKLKEISYIHAEAYAAGELKHGTLALIEEGVPVVALVTQPDLVEKAVSNIIEVKARGARVLAFVLSGLEHEVSPHVDQVFTIPSTHPCLAPILAVIPMQLLAYYTAVARGTDVDKPRNLAKSVTVE